MPRHKVSIACDNCRRKKIKCDAQQPICRSCVTQNEPNCIYSRSKDSRRANRALLPRPKVTTSSTSHTLASAPTQTASIPSPQTTINITKPASYDRTANSLIGAVASNDAAGSTPSSLHASVSANSTSMPPPRMISTTPKDADAMTGEVGDTSTSGGFFGGSSAVSFTRQINSAIDARLGRTQASSSSEVNRNVNSPHARNSSSAQSETIADPLAYTLPPRKFADGLVQDYYGLVWMILPIHDWTIFEKAYEGVWLGNTALIPERELYCLINLAFALGSQFSQSVQPSHRRELGQTFWKRAQKLYDPRLCEIASLEGVQCSLMMGLFLQSTCDSHLCWMTIGSAIRMAQSLGLHLSSSMTKNESARAVEISRRVWHGCVFMDRVLSMTFGRPSMVANWLVDAVPLPLVIDDEYLDSYSESNPIRPDGKATKLTFFIKSCELYSIVNDSLLELYMRPQGKEIKESQSLVSLVEFDNRLVQWAYSIPDPLLLNTDSPERDFNIQRQRIVLRARYLHARILVLRPVLSEFYLGQPKGRGSSSHPSMDKSLSQKVIEQCATLCFEAAHEIINLIYDNLDLDSVTGPVPAWWFATLFLYTAATVLLAERFGPSGPATTSQTWTANGNWDKVVQLLKAYSRVGESAERCVAALQILSAKFSQQSQAQVEVDEEPSLREPQSMNLTHNAGEHFGDLGEMSNTLNLEDIDFNLDDMLWLNTSAADILF